MQTVRWIFHTHKLFARPSTLLLLVFPLIACVSTSPASPSSGYSACLEDPERQALRSQELQALVNEDQQDRSGPINWTRVHPRDEARRKRVGEIFGEGCFKTAKDYAAAALVYQHGNVPDHFFQTYLWAKRAVELGAPSQKRLMAMGVDRYLVNIGHKQLFATQASKPAGSECWCLEDLEESFPESRRRDLAGGTRLEAMTWIDSLNQGSPSCPPAKSCAKGLRSTPPGTVPGLW